MSDITLKNYFNPIRFFKLCKIEFYSYWKNFILKDAIILLIYINLSILYLFNGGYNEPYGFYFVSLVIGIIFSSITFSVVHNSERSLGYFMIPASIEEKFIVKLLFTSVVYFIASLLTISLAYFIVKLINFVFFHGAFTFLYPTFINNIFTIFTTFIFFHSVFFFGAIFFKKHNFLKTFLTIVTTVFIITIAAIIITVSILHNFMMNNVNIQLNNLFGYINNAKEGYLLVIKIFLYYIIPVFLYFISYLRLKKSEVK